jgi:endonuclease/exonuclease/phosphatase family metal-dependent hydrolase
MAPEKKLRIGTFNLQNLQLPNQQTYPKAKPFSQEEYNRRIKWLGDIVLRMNADVIGFQELWSPRCLHDVFEEAKLLKDYHLFVKGGPGSAGKSIQVAAAVRTVVASGSHATWVRDFPNGIVMKKRKPKAAEPDYEMDVRIKRFSRPILTLRVTPKLGSAFVLHVAHFKSKLPMPLDDEERNDPAIREHATALGAALSTIRRTAEACALRALFHGNLKGGTPVVVLGDLNDAPNSMTGSILSADPSFRLFARGRAGNSATGLYSAGMLQDLRSFRDVVYTYVHDGKLESLDHIYVSQHFYDYSDKRIWSFRSMTVINDHLDEIEDKVLKRLYSDHAAVVATFDHFPAKTTGPA